MPSKAPRRTAERILEAALDLFNRHGEPNVSTSAIAAQLGISPGNLYYHYPAKEGLVNALSQRHAQDLQPLLDCAKTVRDMAAAQALLQTLFERLWDYRFLYRDTNDLLSRNRTLEALLRQVLDGTTHALHTMLESLRGAGVVAIEPVDIGPTATGMSLVLTCWFGFEFVRDPRHAQEDASQVLARGAQQALHLLAPYRRHVHNPQGLQPRG